MSEDSTGPSEPAFRTGLRGYERAQVDSFVAEIQAKVASQRNVLPDESDDPVIDSTTGETTVDHL